MGARRIFISYSHKDYFFVQSISSSLNAPEDLVWVDRTFIKPGDVWRKKIEQALKGSYCVLFFASRSSVKSPEVKLEIDYAIHIRKRVIPVIIEKCDLPYEVSNLHHINLINQDLQELKVFREVIAGISKNKGKKAPENKTAAHIVKQVKDSNSFYKTVILPNRFLWTSTLAGLTLIVGLFFYANLGTEAYHPVAGDLAADSATNVIQPVTGIGEIASNVNVSNFTMAAVNMKNGKEGVSMKAKRADKYHISFEVNSKHLLHGKMDLFVVVTNPDGVIVKEDNLGSGTFFIKEEGNKEFTSKIFVDVEQKEHINVGFDLKQVDRYRPGTYKVEIYHEGIKMGGGAVILKKGGLFG